LRRTEVAVFTVLAFGLCAVVLKHPLFAGGDPISLQGHAVAIQRWDNGMVVSVDGTRFFVPRFGQV
jgi:hypothetical protein